MTASEVGPNDVLTGHQDKQATSSESVILSYGTLVRTSGQHDRMSSERAVAPRIVLERRRVNRLKNVAIHSSIEASEVVTEPERNKGGRNE